MAGVCDSDLHVAVFVGVLVEDGNAQGVIAGFQRPQLQKAVQHMVPNSESMGKSTYEVVVGPQDPQLPEAVLAVQDRTGQGACMQQVHRSRQHVAAHTKFKHRTANARLEGQQHASCSCRPTPLPAFPP